MRVDALAHAHANFITPTRNHRHIWQHSQTMCLLGARTGTNPATVPVTVLIGTGFSGTMTCKDAGAANMHIAHMVTVGASWRL
jgi:hypothetical protein